MWCRIKVNKNKINAKSKTKTIKCRPSQDQLKVYCREAANTFNQFEHSFDKIETENFNTELSNITQNRNIKLENDGTTDYSKLTNLGTVNGSTEKYAFISEAFSNK